jgi:Zn finger protein HypA/HybF involved in hydrogenase expression
MSNINQPIKKYNLEPLECKNCHKQFTPHHNQMFCCKECAKKHYRRKQIQSANKQFDKGNVYRLNMSNWSWKKEVRK